MTMTAEIYYDEMGTQYGEEPIPADMLEKACITTIEEGKMTKDLALITTIENPQVLNSFEFIKAIRTKLEELMK